MAKPITNRVKTGKTPVIRKDLDRGVIAEANNEYNTFDYQIGQETERRS